MNARTESAVRDLLRAFMRKWLDDSVADPDAREREGLVAPFHDALAPGIFLLNERSFSTRLPNLHERIAQTLASAIHHHAERAYDLTGTIHVLSREFITQRIDQLERRDVEPDALYERDQLLGHFGSEVSASTRIDLYIRTPNREDHFFEIKSGKPNKGQCIEMKQRLLTAFAIRRSAETYWWWGVPYSPYGASPYTHAYALPFFDFAHEVKMGAEFWDFVGGPGTYLELLELYVEVGTEFADEIAGVRKSG